MAKPDFAAGLSKIKSPALPLDEPAQPVRAKTQKVQDAPSREGKVAISGYFDPAVRQQLQILGIRQEKTMVAMMAEAFNLLFEKYGESPIAKG